MFLVFCYCVICEKSYSDFCSWCKGVVYCFKECWKVDWVVYKFFYVMFVNFDFLKCLSFDYFCGFYIFEENEKFVCIWMKCMINSYFELDNYSEFYSCYENL